MQLYTEAQIKVKEHSVLLMLFILRYPIHIHIVADSST